ncbi:MAG: hypothetical protein ABI623_01875 [bacterium]
MMRQHRPLVILAAGFLIAFSVVLSGCSSSPDAEQMRQLNDLKEEYASLQREVASKEQAKSTLTAEVADKNAKLRKCNDDQAVVKQKLGKK